MFAAIRAGDYYLFEESDDEETVEDDDIDTLTYGQDKGEGDDAGPSPLQVGYHGYYDGR